MPLENLILEILDLMSKVKFIEQSDIFIVENIVFLKVANQMGP